MSDTYKPTEHGGLKADGTPDKRVAGNSEGSNAGRKGGHASGGSDENTNSSSDNKSGGSSSGEFAHGKVDPAEAGRKGGRSS